MTTTPRYRTARTPGFLEEGRALEALSHMGNALERLSAAVDFEAFHPMLEDALRKPAHKSPAGRRPIDPVQMFNVQVLQRTYDLSDELAEYQLTDRASFRAFVDIRTCDDVPEARTV